MAGDKKIEKAEYAKHQLTEEKKKAAKEEKPVAEEPKNAVPAETKTLKETPKKEATSKQAEQTNKDEKAPAKTDDKKEKGKDADKSAPAKEEKKILKESVHTIPLRKAYDCPRTSRVKYAAREVKNYIRKHTRKEPVLDPSVNEALWSRGIQSPPRKIIVKIQEEETRATAVLV